MLAGNERTVSGKAPRRRACSRSSTLRWRQRRHLMQTMEQEQQFARWKRLLAEHLPAEMHGEEGWWEG